MKIGILGGTFDPVHNAHIMIAKQAYKQYKLDKVLFMPSPVPPHKVANNITDVNTRLKMLKVALSDYSYFEVSDFEVNRQGNVYTADTLKTLHKLNSDYEYYFIIGSDSLYTIDSWYKPQVIFDLATILVAKRNDSSLDDFEEKLAILREKYDARIFEINVNISEISSTKIRMLNDKSKLSEYVPEKLADYIIKNNIYGNLQHVKTYTNAEIADELKASLKEKRYIHTLNVADTACKMAQALGENPNKAYLAGLLHDAAKNNEDEKNIEICKKYNEKISKTEYANPYLLHGKAGACIAKYRYNISDPDIYNAIKYHTTGRSNMSLLEKIIFVADYIEPGRTKQKNLDIRRKLAYEDIDGTVYMILSDTLEYLDKTKSEGIDSHTVEAYEFYKNIIEGRTV